MFCRRQAERGDGSEAEWGRRNVVRLSMPIEFEERNGRSGPSDAGRGSKWSLGGIRGIRGIWSTDMACKHDILSFAAALLRSLVCSPENGHVSCAAQFGDALCQLRRCTPVRASLQHETILRPIGQVCTILHINAAASAPIRGRSYDKSYNMTSDRSYNVTSGR